MATCLQNWSLDSDAGLPFAGDVPSSAALFDISSVVLFRGFDIFDVSDRREWCFGDGKTSTRRELAWLSELLPLRTLLQRFENHGKTALLSELLLEYKLPASIVIYRLFF